MVEVVAVPMYSIRLDGMPWRLCVKLAHRHHFANEVSLQGYLHYTYDICVAKSVRSLADFAQLQDLVNGALESFFISI
jgi:hypothetical protein